ncbi:hypothetical protein [Nocardia sp. NPDC058497]|uniref:hypothetical protein n=1 Tax=Nocardia sp. NPDC058497 TaxID=3346529 RepID=UPI0036489469
MLVYFVGGSLGTAFGAAAVAWFGWPATAMIAALSIGVAAILVATTPGDSAPAEHSRRHE